MGKEKVFETKVKSFLKMNDAYFFKYWGGGNFTKAGVPDIIACVKGRFMGIEVKAPNGKPTELQIHNLKKIDEAGGYGILLYPKDFEIFMSLIHSITTPYKYGHGEDDLFYQVMEEEMYKVLKGVWSDDG